METELKRLMRKSRSYRSFDPAVGITREQLLEWIDFTRFAPSSINLQMLKYLPVNTPEDCAKIIPHTRWAGKITDRVLPPKGHEPVAYILICADQTVVPHAENFQKDVGICAQSIMLAAAESGFGGCMIGSFSAKELSSAFSLPDTLIPQLLLALGKPDEEIRLLPSAPDGSVTYFRDGNLHCVRKRSLEDLVILPGKESGNEG